MGGVCTNSKREPDQSGNKRGSQVKELNCLYPGDLIPFMRKPLFLIVDSDNSWVFQSVPILFGQPLVILMSPQDVPSQYQGYCLKFTSLTYAVHIDDYNFFVQTCILKEASLLFFYTVLSPPYASLGKSKKYPITSGKRVKLLWIDSWQKLVGY